MSSAAHDGRLSACPAGGRSPGSGLGEQQTAPGDGSQDGARASELAAAARVEDDLGHVVHAQPQLLGYLIRSQTLLVVQQCQLLLRPTPRLTDHPGSGGPLPQLDAVATDPF